MTMPEEKVLFDRVGQKNPFQVPAGYFEALPQQVMGRITKRRQRNRMWKWAAAAIMAGCICTAGFLMMNDTSMSGSTEAAYMEDELDYSMLNNLDIQEYLTVAE